MNKNKILAIIPARSGSKRILNKNIRSLGQKPLVAWTIETAIASNAFCNILVTTDDQAILNLAKSYGILAPWLRPAELSNDYASSVDVALHATNWYENEFGNVNGIMLLQPTSPFRSINSIKESVEIFQQFEYSYPIISVSKAQNHPAWTFYSNKDKIIPFTGWDNFKLRSQDLPDAFIPTGSIYLINPNQLRANLSFYSEETKPLYIHSTIESHDIDTIEDWEFAESVAKSQASK